MINILVCDDDKDIVDAIEIYLAPEGYHILKAYDGIQAIEMMRSNDIQLLIMDVMMPRMDGIRMTMKLREKYDFPVIMLSAKSEDVDKILGLNIGADDYITKPFNIKEVILRINNLLKRAYDNPSKIQIDGYDIDLEKRRVFYNNNEIILTTKEYDLLVYFLNNKGLAISREQVLSKVWDENYFGSDRVVDDTLRRLRKKMPEINIRTIYGFGYRLD